MTRALLLVIVAALAAACSSTREWSAGGLSLKTDVQSTWKDPKYTAPPLAKIFVISLMKVEPGGRDAVEDAIVRAARERGCRRRRLAHGDVERRREARTDTRGSDQEQRAPTAC